MVLEGCPFAVYEISILNVNGLKDQMIVNHGRKLVKLVKSGYETKGTC
ncbi:AAA domain-containing protein [Psidium guajava]|nr:AAA domain-containing protein [Psidium guajava]